MKVLIDIPSNYKERLDKDFDNLNTGSIGATSILMAVKEGIEIPDNATNGDIIKAIFPNAEIEKWNEYSTIRFWSDEGGINFSMKWWDSPYESEVKE